jgi:hypothetical protein
MGEQDESELHQIILINIDFISSSGGICHSKIISLNSILSSSIIKAGVFVIDNSCFNSSELDISISIKSFNHKSSKQEITNSFNFKESSHSQNIIVFIFLYFKY